MLKEKAEETAHGNTGIVPKVVNALSHKNSWWKPAALARERLSSVPTAALHGHR